MRRFLALALVLSLTAMLAAGCAATPEPNAAPSPEPAPTDNPAAGMRLAPGLYELKDGTVQANGTLEYRDIEGGTWVILDGTKSEGEEGRVLAVIANADELESQLKPLDGKPVNAEGKRAEEGASIRMAGPEIVVDTINEISDAPGIAE